MLRSSSDNTKIKPLVFIYCVVAIVLLAGCVRSAEALPLDLPARTPLGSTMQGYDISADFAALSSAPASFAFTWQEGDVNAYLAARSPASLEIALWCEPGVIYIRLSRQQTPAVTVYAKLMSAITNDDLHLHLADLRIHNIRFSAWLTRLAEDILNDALADSLTHVRFTHVSVDQGSIQLSGSVD